MIVMGCLARNFLPFDWMQYYPETMASYIRMETLAIILMIGGLELDFAGKGLTVVLLTLCPQIWEAAAVGVASHLIIGLPWTMAFAYGFTLAAVSPAVLVPPILVLHKTGYGTAKGIPLTMIAASSFDDIVAITLYGVFITSAMSSAPRPLTETIEE
jgi:NhaP-type Na+/H+ or K+/H+ antiporter